MRRRLASLTAATLLALGLLSSAAFAEPADVPGPPSHEHVLVTPGNGHTVKIGPPVCRVPQADRGARNFHLRVHSSMAGAAPTVKAGLEVHFAAGFPGCPTE